MIVGQVRRYPRHRGAPWFPVPNLVNMSGQAAAEEGRRNYADSHRLRDAAFPGRPTLTAATICVCWWSALRSPMAKSASQDPTRVCCEPEQPGRTAICCCERAQLCSEVAEGERFELSVDLESLRRFSKPLLSTTQPPLRLAGTLQR